MEVMQRLPSLSSASSHGSREEFPAGLRVLVVDDDVTCLKIIDVMLRQCRYRVTTCCQATIALSLLRESKGDFDLVISDVHMPDMDGFKLLELVGIEMDLPVIMMSADQRTSAVMRGIEHGARDYLIKPVRMEELQNIWQHVIRKKYFENKELELSSSLEDSDRNRQVVDDADYASSVNNGMDGTWRSQKKKRDSKGDEGDGELDNEDPSSKKPRVVWSVELHQQFVSAVNQLGIDKAVPKRILELMNVPGLTRENVASHLQKFRLYLKRLSGVAQHQSELPNSFFGPAEPNSSLDSLSRLGFQALAASGQIPLQTLAALNAELLGQPSVGLALPAIDQPVIMKDSVQRSKCVSMQPGIAFGEQQLKCQPNISRQLPLSNIPIEDSSRFSVWSSDVLDTTGSSTGVTSTQNANMLAQMLQTQQTYHTTEESTHAMNVHPSCLVVPSQPSKSLQIGNNPVSLNQNSVVVPSQASTAFQWGINSINGKQGSDVSINHSVVDYIPLSSQSNNVSLDMGQVTDKNFKNIYAAPISLPSCSTHTDSSNSWRIHNVNVNYVHGNELPSYLPSYCLVNSEPYTVALPDIGHQRYLGFVGKGTSVPCRFAMDDIDSPANGISDKKCTNDDGGRAKEIQLDILDGSKYGNHVLPYHSANDSTGVIPKDEFAGCFLKS